MTEGKPPRLRPVLACICLLLFSCPSLAQVSNDAIHEIKVLLKARGGEVGGVRVRLLWQARMQPVSDTYSGKEGELRFTNLLPGEYIVETSETERFEATATRVTVIPIDVRKPRSTHITVSVDLPARQPGGTAPPGVVLADVDLDVPEAARKHYRKGLESSRAGRSADSTKEFKAAVEAYPKFYAARLELGRELRAQKRFSEAEEALKPLGEIAPRHAEPRLEYAVVLLALRRPKEAASELRKALELEEASWAAHLNLGWALLEDQPEEAERHFTRALELDERRAAQAHLSLARLVYRKGMRQDSIRHLEAYLALEPKAPDAPSVRKLLEQLRKVKS
ncbi:MAG TPA: tetratricopeptide repeat protein [Pyrinomonadaceae bacterium]